MLVCNADVTQPSLAPHKSQESVQPPDYNSFLGPRVHGSFCNHSVINKIKTTSVSIVTSHNQEMNSQDEGMAQMSNCQYYTI